MRADAIYTPSELAQQLIGAAKPGFDPKTVIDITAGNGELLRSAGTKWKNAKIYACDIDSTVTRKLRKAHHSWAIRTADALTDNLAWPDIRTFDLVVLNPPFSCRGGSRYHTQIDAEEITCSRAGVFLAKGLSLLSSKGQLLAILPVGALENEKDVELWRKINKSFRARVITENCPKSFPGLRVRTLIIRFTKRPRSVVSVDGSKKAVSFTGLSNVRRGTCAASFGHEFRRGSLPFLHTTQLKREQLIEHTKFANWHWSITGPVVLIARVGNPNCVKVASYTNRKRVVISDCLFSISCSTSTEAINLAKTLGSRWDEIRQLYKGTCAQFLTLERLKQFLLKNRLALRSRA